MTAGAPASASITARGAIARTAGAPASASITARGTYTCKDYGGAGVCEHNLERRLLPQLRWRRSMSSSRL
jgi:hypothetical protein